MMIPPHKHEYEFIRYCGADVCTFSQQVGTDPQGDPVIVSCHDHKGLARCFCGWNLGANEQLEDDVGDARFDGEAWSVEY